MNEAAPDSRGTIYIVPDQGQEEPLPRERFADSRDAPSLRDYWQIARKHRWRIIGCFVAAVAIAALSVLLATPIYTAKAKVVIERKGPQIVNSSADSVEADEHKAWQSQYEILRSRSLAAEVIRSLGLEKSSVLAGRTASPVKQLWSAAGAWLNGGSGPPPGRVEDPSQVDPRLIHAYEQMLDIEPVKHGRLVDIVVRSPDASLSAAIANAHANAFIGQGIKWRSRAQEVETAAEISAANIYILDRAEVPLLPSEPQKRATVMIAAVLGLMLGLGWAFLAEHFDDTLRTPEDVERNLHVTNLVAVPDFFSLPKNSSNRRRPFKARKPVVDAQPCVPANLRFSVITEAYRKLRTSILYSRPGRPPRTILFTSSAAGEGKTISVTNTAIVFAHLGFNCLVLDADLRRPQCHRVLRMNNDRGLTDFLVGREDLETVIQPTTVAHLSLLNCGAPAPNPAELLGSQNMQQALKRLCDRFDFIFIDSPPVMPVSDAAVLSNMVDGVVFVVRGQQTPKNWVKGALSELRGERSKLLGVVLNRVDLRSVDYEDYYRYYDGEYHSSVRLA